MPNETRNRGLILMWFVLGIAALLFLPTTARAQTPAAAPPPGALIRMDMNSVVGVKLDDIPAGAQREAAADWPLSQQDDFWEKRASTQVNLTYYRLVFRTFFYTAAITALPLPPHSVALYATAASRCQAKSIPALRGPRSTCFVEPADQNRSFVCAKRVRCWASEFPART